MKHLFVLLLAAVLCLGNAQVRFDNYQVYEVVPKTQIQLDVLRQIQITRESYNFWTDVTFLNQAVDIMIAPHLKAEFQEIAVRLNLSPVLKIENIQTLIDQEKESNMKTSSTFDWTRYQKLDEIHAWLRSLEEQYPDKVTVIKGGESYEGREILGIKLSFKSGNKGVFIEGGIHAIEWISPATVTYIANELLTSNDPAVRKVAESRDWYIFPSINPDGYVYTHTTHTIGQNAATALAKRYGTKYKVGNIPETIYICSGGSLDWAVGKHRNIRIGYSYELRDRGRYGFFLPAKQIIPTGEETLDSLVSIFQQADA